VATAVVPLPAATGVGAYFVEVAREGDLVVAAQTEPPPGSTRDARAQFWLQQPRQKLASAFYRVTQEPVPVGAYPHALPGDLRELVAFRLVPVGAKNNAAAEPSKCAFTLYAVPRDVAPPPPILLVDRSSVLAVLEVRAAPGAVPAAEARIRALSDLHADPRTGRIVARGPLEDGIARFPVLAGAYVAEVRGASEVGVTPARGRWSASSTPLHV
jgi:hypothetical protein